MCGRYNLRITAAELQQVFNLFREPDWEPRFDIRPSQQVLAIRFDENATPREPVRLKWGFLPPWAKDQKAQPQPINAKAEHITGRMWGPSFKQRRCLLPATGFYEWQSIPGQKKKQPMLFTIEDQEPFALAGLWTRWETDGDSVESCAVITTIPNEIVSDVHDRMPVILHADDYDQWLDPASKPPDLNDLLSPYAGQMHVRPHDPTTAG